MIIFNLVVFYFYNARIYHLSCYRIGIWVVQNHFETQQSAGQRFMSHLLQTTGMCCNLYTRYLVTPIAIKYMTTILATDFFS